MIKKTLILVFGIMLILSCISVVNANEVTMTVNSKHIIGSGLGNSPFDLEDCINVVYVISERQMNGGPDKYIVQEYPVGIQDYCNIKIGQKVTLEVPESRLKQCKVIKIEG